MVVGEKEPFDALARSERALGATEAKYSQLPGGNAVTVPDDVKLRVHVANVSPTHAFLLLPHVQLTLGRSPICSFFLDLLAFKTSGRTS